MKRNKALTILLTLAFALTLSACGKGGNSNQEEDTIYKQGGWDGREIFRRKE